ncbi:hypothetical protein N9A94_01205, partial [Akkermansiaceae bacterium]|nr:hypothetical protein [Akkermansiaceae bacterium]
WRAYLKDKLKIRARNATNYMRIWNKTKNFETLTDYFKSENIDHLGVGGLLRYFADKKQEKKKAEDAERKDILNEDPEVQRNTSDPIKLADGSPLDTRKLNLENGLIDQTSLAKRFTAIKSSDLPGTARVQRVTAHLVGGLNKAVGRKRGAEALDLAEAAAMDLLDLIQATKNNHKTA